MRRHHEHKAEPEAQGFAPRPRALLRGLQYHSRSHMEEGFWNKARVALFVHDYPVLVFFLFAVTDTMTQSNLEEQRVNLIL